MKKPCTFTIDVWQDESIWTWDGVATSEEEAQESARLVLNQDWEREYETWDDLASDMDGTALIQHEGIMTPRLPLASEQLSRLMVMFAKAADFNSERDQRIYDVLLAAQKEMADA
jgi:hypothetical protein